MLNLVFTIVLFDNVPEHRYGDKFTLHVIFTTNNLCNWISCRETSIYNNHHVLNIKIELSITSTFNKYSIKRYWKVWNITVICRTYRFQISLNIEQCEINWRKFAKLRFDCTATWLPFHRKTIVLCKTKSQWISLNSYSRLGFNIFELWIENFFYIIYINHK